MSSSAFSTIIYYFCVYFPVTCNRIEFLCLALFCNGINIPQTTFEKPRARREFYSFFARFSHSVQQLACRTHCELFPMVFNIWSGYTQGYFFSVCSTYEILTYTYLTCVCAYMYRLWYCIIKSKTAAHTAGDGLLDAKFALPYRRSMARITSTRCLAAIFVIFDRFCSPFWYFDDRFISLTQRSTQSTCTWWRSVVLHCYSV